MRQPPELADDTLTDHLRTVYDLPIVSCRFLPIGYDLDAFVYEARGADRRAFFVKARNGAGHPPSVLVPRVLIEAGIPNVLAPLRTKAGALWSSLDRHSVVVYPYIRGENAKAAGLSDRQWREFGATLRAIHSGGFASLLRGQVPTETFSISSARLLRRLSAGIQDTRFESPAAGHLASFWRDNTPLIEHILGRAEALSKQLQSRSFEHVLCHADIHAANILVSEEGRIYLVDWDGPLLAPRERDLLFIVGSVIGRPVEPREEALFFQGYGTVEVDATALAYYRYERAIEDIGGVGQRVFFDTDQSEEAKAYEAARLRTGFEPGNIIESAMQADRNQGGPSFSMMR